MELQVAYSYHSTSTTVTLTTSFSALDHLGIWIATITESYRSCNSSSVALTFRGDETEVMAAFALFNCAGSMTGDLEVYGYDRLKECSFRYGFCGRIKNG
ncbi:hypothetical protein OIU74_017731 [Salix koriyanagi]|uniref:Uncharacterized protein n=1 Tax=Salix koriyanagi TaxID=2511006 RepID=A0A9Q0WR83_9ROSI|nr:hypothetical protein OIU74_017731 [Salix koriyanagi]